MTVRQARDTAGLVGRLLVLCMLLDRLHDRLYSGESVELCLCDSLAVAVECSSKLYRELPHMEVAVHYTAFLESEGILHEDIALNLAPEVDVRAYDIAADDGCLADDDTALRLDLAFECSVDTDIAWRDDLSLYHCSCRYPADGIYINSSFCLCHNYNGFIVTFIQEIPRQARDDKELQAFAVAVLELLTAAAWTWVITSDLLFYMDRHLALRLAAVGNEVGA